ncbi:MAG: hypothetical protein HC919_07415 [Oscillatoriales cyanobacterium SM2_2_1]|nr:hypothetical protein [Oscillatoriales cyanobacterium SM2_2_1]
MNRWRWCGMALVTLFLAWACTTTTPQEPVAVIPATRPVVMDYLKAGELSRADAEMRGWLSVNGTDDEVRFGLGIVQVLQGVEHVMQSFYRYGLTNDGFGGFLPLFRLPVPPNPHPQRRSPMKTSTASFKLGRTISSGRESPSLPSKTSKLRCP